MTNQEDYSDAVQPLSHTKIQANVHQEVGIKDVTTFHTAPNDALRLYNWYVENFNTVNKILGIRLDRCCTGCCGPCFIKPLFSRSKEICEFITLWLFSLFLPIGLLTFLISLVSFLHLLPAYIVYRKNLKKCHGDPYLMMVYEPGLCGGVTNRFIEISVDEYFRMVGANVTVDRNSARATLMEYKQKLGSQKVTFMVYNEEYSFRYINGLRRLFKVMTFSVIYIGCVILGELYIICHWNLIPWIADLFK